MHAVFATFGMVPDAHVVQDARPVVVATRSVGHRWQRTFRPPGENVPASQTAQTRRTMSQPLPRGHAGWGTHAVLAALAIRFAGHVSHRAWPGEREMRLPEHAEHLATMDPPPGENWPAGHCVHRPDAKP